MQGIPAVFAIKDGKVVDGFIGAQPEAQVAASLDRLAPAPPRPTSSWPRRATRRRCARRSSSSPATPRPSSTLAELLVAKGDGPTEEALALLARIPETAETRRGRRPGPHRGGRPTRSIGDVEAKLDDLLDRVKDDDDARQEFVDLLEVMGADDPRTAQYRRKLTNALF